ncbi:MAG: flagellar biosynthesis protein FlhA [Ilumatobacter sp.]|uniref:flagellar biosynthesis protein FlhA n=1 Tax=Ilumatobacter sp. TaxID=1967498 RepID=UPI00260E308A|nr:flagellar biosynthesis protein FlhA [Ilumatobacter sp.]MDJ0767433.1 flagellar biosynthesis protein FlhA [Ilumatobacter sp.]
MQNSRLAQAGFPAIIVLVVTVMILPLPSSLLDLLIVANISTAVLILLVSTNVKRALDFSSFPSLLLVVTLIRIGLNVSTSRAVLSRGDAGNVIETFGSFVVGGNIVVGIVIFLIITLVQFVVISNGAGRVAEVSARFTLDAMPGKQMAIDADLNAGILSEEEAKLRRSEVADEADFYGAMDGASKFVKGDAIAGLVITLVNLVGGLIVGVLQLGMSFGDAVATYSMLTVGDGLVAQIPALLVSISSGLIVTRSAGDNDLGSDVFGQFARQGTSVRSGGVVVLLMSLVPGLPKLPFIVFGVGLILLGRYLISREGMIVEVDEPDVDVETAPPSPQQMAIDARVEPLELDLAADLIDLVDGASGGDLLDRVGALRRKIAGELGFVMPAIRTRDEPDLPAHTYALSVHGVEVGRGTVPPGRVLVIGDGLGHLPGDDIVEPVFGLPARWVPTEFRIEAEHAGHTVVDRAALIVTHLAELVRRRAGRLLSRSDVKALLDGVNATDPAVVEDLTAAGVGLADVQRVLATMLDEGIGIRDLVRILEAVGERAHTSRAVDALVEAGRAAVGPAITGSLATDGVLSVATIHPRFEAELAASVELDELGAQLRLPIHAHEHLMAAVNCAVDAAAARGLPAVIVCSPVVRPALARLLRQTTSGISIVSYAEIGDHLDVDVVHSIDPLLTDHTDKEHHDAQLAPL